MAAIIEVDLVIPSSCIRANIVWVERRVRSDPTWISGFCRPPALPADLCHVTPLDGCGKRFLHTGLEDRQSALPQVFPEAAAAVRTRDGGKAT